MESRGNWFSRMLGRRMPQRRVVIIKRACDPSGRSNFRRRNTPPSSCSPLLGYLARKAVLTMSGMASFALRTIGTDVNSGALRVTMIQGITRACRS